MEHLHMQTKLCSSWLEVSFVLKENTLIRKFLKTIVCNVLWKNKIKVIMEKALGAKLLPLSMDGKY